MNQRGPTAVAGLGSAKGVNEMAVLSDTSIKRLRKAGILGIEPFHDPGIQPASYDAGLYWKILLSPTRTETGRVIDLRNEPELTFYVEPGRFVGTLTEEVFRMPPSLSGRFGLRSAFTRHGLIAFGGIQIDPGWTGRLAISLFNAGPEPIGLEYQSRLFTVEFHTLEAPASEGYAGEFQDQLDFPRVQEEFILNAHTVSLAEIASLPTEMATLRQRLTLHEAAHRSPRPLSLEELVKAQGVRPVEDPSKLLGGWPDDDDFEEFIATIRRERERPQ